MEGKAPGRSFAFVLFLKTVDQDTAVPASVEDGDPSAFRRLRPKAPEERMHPVLPPSHFLIGYTLNPLGSILWIRRPI